MSSKLLALGMILGLAACGGGDQEAEPAEGTGMETSVPTTPAAAPMDTTMGDTVISDSAMVDSLRHDTMRTDDMSDDTMGS